MRQVSRREALAGTGLALAAATRATAQSTEAIEPSPAKRPNIIFILTDDLGYGEVSCYGQRQIATPCLDAMAAEGTRFAQCYAGSTVCAPSRCCLMTGLHTGHARIRGNALVPLEPGDITVAGVLKEAGYYTGLIGKWGLGEPGTPGVPNRQGFDYFFGYLNQRHAHNYYPDHLWRNEERISIEGNQLSDERPGVAIERAQYSHDLFTAEALRFVEQHRNGPFFLYLAYTIPHANNEAGKEGMEVPELGEYADRDWPLPQKGHAAMISRMDRDVGQLLDKLRALGIDQDTLVVFSSDNGPHKEGGADPAFFQSAGPLRGYKRDLYEGGIRVPAIAWWPGTVPARAVSEHVWAFWDFLPTAAELGEADIPKGLDGVSIAPVLTGKADPGSPPPQHEFLYWEFHEGPSSKQAVRMGHWKAVRLDPEGPIELYGLLSDLGETNDVSSAHPDVVKRIRGYLKTARTPNTEWPLRKRGARP